MEQNIKFNIEEKYDFENPIHNETKDSIESLNDARISLIVSELDEKVEAESNEECINEQNETIINEEETEPKPNAQDKLLKIILNDSKNEEEKVAEIMYDKYKNHFESLKSKIAGELYQDLKEIQVKFINQSLVAGDSSHIISSKIMKCIDKLSDNNSKKKNNK